MSTNVYNNLIITNNTFTTDGNALVYIDGATIENNIFASGNFSDCDNNVIRYNVFTRSREAAFDDRSESNTINNNLFGAVISQLFVVASPAATGEIDNTFRPGPDSQATGAGVDGIDAGAFGGATPYRLSGMPAIPSIFELSTTGVGNNETGMKVTIKAISHQ